jgi:hypothetical protein
MREEVGSVGRGTVTKEAVRRFAVRSTKSSASLERRSVPAGFERSDRVERYLAKRRSHR